MFYCFSLNFVYIINRKIHGCLEIPDLFLVLNMISHSFAALTREILCSTLEINLVFPRTHVLFSIYPMPKPTSVPYPRQRGCAKTRPLLRLCLWKRLVYQFSIFYNKLPWFVSDRTTWKRFIFTFYVVKTQTDGKLKTFSCGTCRLGNVNIVN